MNRIKLVKEIDLGVSQIRCIYIKLEDESIKNIRVVYLKEDNSISSITVTYNKIKKSDGENVSRYFESATITKKHLEIIKLAEQKLENDKISDVCDKVMKDEGFLEGHEGITLDELTEWMYKMIKSSKEAFVNRIKKE